MLKVWGRRTSSNVQALMWCIGELGLPYTRYDIGGRYGGTDTSEFYAINPNRTVPVLQDDENPPLWETGCILRYLATRYASVAFWPSELIARTEVDRWAEWSKLNVALTFTGPVFWHVVRTPIQQRDPLVLRSALDVFEQKLAIAEIRLHNRTYLAGNDLTLADIQFGHVLFRYYDIDIERATLPYLEEYYSGLLP